MDSLTPEDCGRPDGPTVASPSVSSPPQALRWVRDPDVLWRSVSRGVVILTRDGEAVRLSPTGAALWTLLVDPVTIPEVAERLGHEYAQPTQGVADDVGPVVEELHGLGLVHLVP